MVASFLVELSAAAGARDCKVLSGLIGVLVQAALFACCVLALSIRFALDQSGRTFPQKLADGSKNMAGAALLHCLNLIGARLLAESGPGDQCANYWSEIMIDTTVGVGVEWLLLWALIKALEEAGRPRLADLVGGPAPDFWAAPSDNGGPLLPSTPSASLEKRRAAWNAKVRRYAAQLAAWLVVVTGMKTVMMGVLVAGRPLIEPVAAWVLAPFLANPDLKLVMVMILTPVFMNAVQFWLADGVMVRVRTTNRPAWAFPSTAPVA